MYNIDIDKYVNNSLSYQNILCNLFTLNTTDSY